MQEWDAWYRFDTKCPQCSTHTMQGCWSRPDVIYEDCEACGYSGPLDTTVTELLYRFGALVGEKIYKKGKT